MTKKEKNRNREGAPGRSFNAGNSTAHADPLAGWIDLGKRSRINRRHKGNWRKVRR